MSQVTERRTAALPFLALVMLGTTWSMIASAQESSSAKPHATTASASPVHEITLPQYPPELAAGPNLSVYQKRCLTCHSARYVTMQPRFPRSVWEKEVKKMVEAYGAAVPEAEQQQIVDYLVAVRGPAEGK